jgi:hypothetical protein
MSIVRVPFVDFSGQMKKKKKKKNENKNKTKKIRCARDEQSQLDCHRQADMENKFSLTLLYKRMKRH